LSECPRERDNLVGAELRGARYGIRGERICLEPNIVHKLDRLTDRSPRCGASCPSLLAARPIAPPSGYFCFHINGKRFIAQVVDHILRIPFAYIPFIVFISLIRYEDITLAIRALQDYGIVEQNTIRAI
jgi:hypothetical protein